MTAAKNDIRKPLVALLGISFVARLFAAAFVEFGNDEVYYWTYALYPALSHFDHPPMVGWMIQFFSLNLLFDSELAIRLSSVVFMTIDTYIIYLIGKEAKDELTGLYAALLYTGSVYAFIITGVFIMPDTPLSLFWLLATLLATRWLRSDTPSAWHILLTGLLIGLAFLSKYTGMFIWVGIGLYTLIFDRKKLRDPWLYVAILISIACTIPVVYWNWQNDFISFGFHSERVSLFSKPNMAYFGTELGGELLYNNPVNFVLAVVAVVAFFKGRLQGDACTQRLIVCTALPLIAVFWFFALTRPTLPHWNSPAFNLLIVLSAMMLRGKNDRKDIPRPIVASLSLIALVLVLGIVEIKTGIVPLDRHTEAEKLGRDDFTLDMYGWHKFGEEFGKLREKSVNEGAIDEDCGIIAHKWFPLANLDYYVARPLGMKAFGLGQINDIHKYHWINELRGSLQPGSDYWYITDSHYYNEPNAMYDAYFEDITLIDTITIDRCGKPAKNFFVYKCTDLKKLPANELDER
mgnify:CR=1 FL=1